MTSMKTIRTSKASGGLRRDSGQVTIFVVLALGIFLLGAMGFAVDMANLWFHRQSAQTAADAACTAGAMDLLVDATNAKTTQGGFTAGTDFDCSGATGVAPCQYAALNGYNASLAKNSSASSLGNEVYATFPASVSGVSAGAVPPATLAPTPYIRIDVVDHVQVFLSAMLSGSRSQPVHASAVCGLVLASAPTPLLILRPTDPNTLQITGSGGVTIIGGPSRSIQVNSGNSSAAFITANVDLCKGGPLFTGSDLGTFGGPSVPTVLGACPAGTGFRTGPTGRWAYPTSPIADPYAKVVPPTQPVAAPAPTAVAGPTATTPGVDGCPDRSGSNTNQLPNNLVNAAGNLVTATPGCVEYHPGFYDRPIVVKQYTAIFEPGLYYMRIPNTTLPNTFDPGNCGTPGGGIVPPTGQCHYSLAVDTQGVVRPATPATPSAQADASHGVTFYLSGTSTGGYGSVFFGSNSGKAGSRTIDNFVTSPDPTNGTAAACPGGAAPDSRLAVPTSVSGDVLLGPCTYDGSYFASATNTNDGSGVPKFRGMVFFQDRADGDNHGQPSMQGGGGLLVTGNMYFHNCPGSPSCNASSDYNAFLQFQGNSGSGTFLLGNITVDELNTGGAGAIAMQLNPNSIYYLLKVSLLR